MVPTTANTTPIATFAVVDKPPGEVVGEGDAAVVILLDAVLELVLDVTLETLLPDALEAVLGFALDGKVKVECALNQISR